MILTDLHVHTNYCDGKNTPEEMVLAAIEKALGQARHHVVLTLPYSMGGMVDTLHSNAKVNSMEYTGDGIVVDAILDDILWGRLKEYITKEC